MRDHEGHARHEKSAAKTGDSTKQGGFVLGAQYAHLDGEKATSFAGGAAFWSRLMSGEHDEISARVAAGGWLVASYQMTQDTSTWEMHPDGDEILYLVSGEIEVILEEQGLLAAIEWHLPVFERQTGIRVDYQRQSARAGIHAESAIHVFRILQESLNNVARHANVEEVRVTLDEDESWFTLAVEDRGRGMGAAPRPGVGLTAMRERAALINGTLEIAPGREGGTRVFLRVPREVPIG